MNNSMDYPLSQHRYIYLMHSICAAEQGLIVLRDEKRKLSWNELMMRESAVRSVLAVASRILRWYFLDDTTDDLKEARKRRSSVVYDLLKVREYRMESFDSRRRRKKDPDVQIKMGV